MARSLGKAVGKQLEKKEESFTEDMTDELAALLQTAGLIHDLGNPPFGHYGETVIRQWFCGWFESNNLRIVTKLQILNDAYGANFTYGTLATIIKYPWRSDSKATTEKNKFGYFKSEEQLVEEIRKAMGLSDGQRHPATFLLEAADDIIYVCDDIEDGVKKGYIPWELVYNTIKKQFDSDEYQELYEKMESKAPDENIEEGDKILSRVRIFRNFTQGYLFEIAINEFMKHYDSIISGTYKKELLDSKKDFVDYLKKSVTGKYCFT